MVNYKDKKAEKVITMRKTFVSMIAAAALSAGAVMPAFGTEVTLGRFFGSCQDAGTDVSAAVGEACIIQSIINAFDAENDDFDVTTLPTDWGNYYDQIIASYASGNPPDVHVMHRHRIPEYGQIGALADLTDDLMAHGIDPDDWTYSAREAVTWNDRILGVPMDLHANLWHVNMGLMEAAGLVEDGRPILPSSPEEMMEHAERVREATGEHYLAADFAEFPIGVRMVLACLWQQDSNIFANGTATINTPEARNALGLITQLFDEEYANPRLNYADSQQSFLSGEAAILVNGTWVVDFYAEQAADNNVALTDYYVADFPTLFEQGATWADTHLWTIPASVKRDNPEVYEGALKLLAFINDHNIDWARTGHAAVRESVLNSDEYAELPHRSEYDNTVNIARDTPASARYGAIQDILNREFQAIWLTGKSIDAALSDAEEDVQSQLDR